jgi:hypothetical protein
MGEARVLPRLCDQRSALWQRWTLDGAQINESARAVATLPPAAGAKPRQRLKGIVDG